MVKRAKIVKNSENEQNIHIWGGFWVLDGPKNGTSICLKIDNTKAKPRMRHGGLVEWVKRVK